MSPLDPTTGLAIARHIRAADIDRAEQHRIARSVRSARPTPSPEGRPPGRWLWVLRWTPWRDQVAAH